MSRDFFQNVQWIDLTHTVHENIPTWSGSCGYHEKVVLDYDPYGVRVMKFSIHGGLGTHVDAPCHFREGIGVDIAEIPLNQCIGRAHVIDLSHRCAPDLMLKPDDLLEYEKREGPIEPGSFVFFYSGWSRFWEQPLQYRNADSGGHMHFPGFDGACAPLLLERGIQGIGLDTLSPDGADHEFPIHKALLGEKKIIIENLNRLEHLIGREAYFFAPPPKFAGACEAPVRAFAALPSKP